jgi:predicted house-cleaning noncanonical NTP pyrophosphatase (MazG superfamily)
MKLVRDKYDQERTKTRLTKTEDEFRIFLRAKLVEEATEVMVSMDRKNLIEEIGDVLDVVDGLLRCYKINTTVLQKSRLIKRKLKGGFTKGIIKLK